MAYASDWVESPSGNGKEPGAAAFPSERPSGLFLRVMKAISDWTDGADEAGAAAFIARSGGRLSDSVEREMFSRQTISNWNVEV